MIEFTIKEHLEKNLDVPVYFEFPQDPPGRFLILKKETNPRENYVDSALLVVDSYGISLMDAATLNTMAKKTLDDLATLPNISASRRGGDYPAFDTANKRYRCQAVQNITYYEE